MASLRKRNTATGFIYVIDFTHEGRRIVRSTKTDDLKIAQQILDDIRGKIARGTFGLNDVEKKHINLRTYFQEYFNNVKSEKKASTIQNETHYANAFISFAGDCHIDSIDIRILKRWKAFMLTKEARNGGTISPATFNINRRFLKAAFNEAVNYGYLQKNPFKELKEAKVDEKRLHLLDSELEKILQLIDKDIKKTKIKKHITFLNNYRILVEFLLNTGLRKSEALNLAWKDIDLENNVIHIEKTKTGRSRIVPLNEVALECIESIGPELFQKFNPFHISRKFHSYVKRLNLSGMKLHSLRHTFATNLNELGEDTSVIQKLLGHQDIRTTQIYAKANTARLLKAVQKLDRRNDERGKTDDNTVVKEQGSVSNKSNLILQEHPECYKSVTNCSLENQEENREVKTIDFIGRNV